ncbi:MAG: ATP-binding protein [Oscillospiraceae bacterium]
MEPIIYTYTVPGDDFTRAGEASADLKNKLKVMGIAGGALRNVSISLYEGEINLAIHAGGGSITAKVYPDKVDLSLDDNGPGIADISLAMKEGYSSADDTVRSLGFGAGMGLPNMKKYADTFDIQSKVGQGTHIKMTINL